MVTGKNAMQFTSNEGSGFADPIPSNSIRICYCEPKLCSDRVPVG